jgi:hypothetical protein
MLTTDLCIRAMLVVSLVAAAVLAVIWVRLAIEEVRRMRASSKLRRTHELHQR